MSLVKLLSVGVLVALLTACAATPKKESSTKPATQVKVEQVATYESMMKEADDAHKLGHTEVAFEQYKKVAAIHEKRKEPLQKMAQIKFDNNQYGPAIQYAQEVMRLEPSDQLANSIVAVAGLRLSATSLGVLRRENQLSGSVKSEATGLADVLRQNLGVEEIVPPVQAKKTKRKSVVTTTSSTPNKKATGSADKSGGDPFGALK